MYRDGNPNGTKTKRRLINMRVGLFIPCFIDQFYPQVGLATVTVLQRYGVDVHFPTEQTCCGQPMANVGMTDEARPLAEHFLRIFSDYDYVVGPTGSCVSMVRNHYGDLLAGDPHYESLQRKTFEFCEFLHDVLEVRQLEGRFPHRVGLHKGCHGLRELRLGSCSERVVKPFDKVVALLETLKGIHFSQLQRSDECCGFGGTFAVSEEAVSCMMGQDRLRDHLQAGTEVLTSVDMSCLMHLKGLLDRDNRRKETGQLEENRLMERGRQPPRVMHVAELIAESQSPKR